MMHTGAHRRVACWLGLAVAYALALGACGPIGYVSGTTYGAANAVDTARAANAAKWSPYWWTRATEYLHKAREEAAYSNFQAANHFGRLAKEAALKARDEAIRLTASVPLTPRPGGSPGHGAAGRAGSRPRSTTTARTETDRSDALKAHPAARRSRSRSSVVAAGSALEDR